MPSLSIASSADASTLDIRSLTSAQERREAFAIFRQALLGISDIALSSPDAEARFLAEGQSLGCFEKDALRGVANGYESSVTVPGGQRVRHLSVTHVGVSPDATRRGIARQLLVEQLRRARLDGYVVAGLRASDTGIYGRYGYGIASWSVRHELDLTRTAPAVDVPREGLRIVDARESFALFRRIADSDPAPRSITLSRWDGWWAMQEFRTIHGTTPHHAVVFGTEGRERGFLRFHIEPSDNWFTSSQRTVIVDDFVAHDDEAWRGLIGHLFAQDILHRAVFPSRPVDDPLPLLLRNPRALEISGQRDESWIRPLDLEALLSARQFGGTRQIAIAVDDDLFPENHGTWSLGPQGIAKTPERPEARVAIADLAALVFGASQPLSLAMAGRLSATAPTVVEELGTAFSINRQPHSGISF